MPIHYIQGDATCPIGDGDKVIAHICNDIGAWGAGFVLAISNKWIHVEQDYRNWSKGNSPANPNDPPYPEFKLGKVRCVQVEDNIWVANMIAQHNIYTKNNIPPIRYDALELCLVLLNKVLNGASIHMPRIGCGLAGGQWCNIEPIILETLPDIEVYVYDLPGI